MPPRGACQEVRFFIIRSSILKCDLRPVHSIARAPFDVALRRYTTQRSTAGLDANQPAPRARGLGAPPCMRMLMATRSGGLHTMGSPSISSKQPSTCAHRSANALAAGCRGANVATGARSTDMRSIALAWGITSQSGARRPFRDAASASSPPSTAPAKPAARCRGDDASGR